MGNTDEAVRERLSALTAEKRALLVTRFANAGNSALMRQALPTPISREDPQRVDVDGDGRDVAVHFASDGQQRMSFMHHFASDSPVYNTPSAFHLSGRLQPAVLESAFRQVIARHDILRTVFAVENGELVQRISSSSNFELEQISFADADEDDRRSLANRYIADAAACCFDLFAAPPFRVVLASIGPDEHVLLILIHHILSDGWSLSNLCRELSILYAGLAAGSPVTLPPLAVQFADYSTWQRRWMESATYKAQENYWAARLGGEQEPLGLPSDRTRPASMSFGGDECSLQIDSDLVSDLKTLARESHATLFMVLLAAFKVLLFRYTGQSNLLVGVPIANRKRPELEGLIGPFVNTIVMRTELSGDTTFETLLGRVKETALGAYEHQEMPLEMLLRCLRIERDCSRTPLYQTTFALQDYPDVNLQLCDVKAAPARVRTHTSKFDISLLVRPDCLGLNATLEFNADLFDSDRAARMLEHWREILRDVAAHPTKRVSELTLLTASERHRVLVEWNATRREGRLETSIHTTLESRARAAPDAVAVVVGPDSLTYGELDRRAKHVAQHLHLLGVRRNDIVAMSIERSFDRIIALFAILKAGAAYWAIENNIPTARLQGMLADAAPALFLHQRKSPPLVLPPKGDPPKNHCIEDLLEADAVEHPSALPDANAADAAYLCFTSGSTGGPKGVLVPHRGVMRLVAGDFASLGSGECLLHHSPMAFDASTFEVWGTLLSGARLVLLAPGLPSPAAIGEAIRQHGVTTLWLTAGLFHLMVDEFLDDLKPLRQLLAGGDTLSPEHVRKARAALPDCRIVNAYGPTENTTFTCCYVVSGEETFASGVPIGRSIANTQIYILDEKRQPVPIGIPGELYTGGDGLAISYLNQPHLTAEKFITHAFNREPGARLYKTGDLARWRSDGNVMFLGRRDSQIKIRGFRVETGEVEATLASHPAVTSCAVVARGVNGGKELLAFVVRSADDSSFSSLRTWLAQKLPAYMLPSRIQELRALPLTLNGKVDLRALRLLDSSESDSRSIYVAPRNQREREFVGTWQAVLRRDDIGIQSNFFDLGGHSLLAVSLNLRLTSLLGVEVPLRWLFEYPTIETLIERIESTGAELEVAVALEAVDRQGPIAMSFAQQQMWLLRQTLPDPATYNQPVAWRLSGSVDWKRVRVALRRIVERHEVLRTALLQEGNLLLQKILEADALPLPWKEFDLRAIPADQRQARFTALMLDEARQSFDLSEPPLWRAARFKLAENENVFALTFHHSVMDDWSSQLFFRELESTYKDEVYANGGHSNLAANLPAQYADYSSWQRSQLRGDPLTQWQTYWTEQLRDLPPDLELPADLNRPQQLSGRGAVYDFQLAAPISDDLRAIARHEGTTLFVVMLAAFQVWLYRLSGQTDLIVSSPVTSRERPEAKSLLGYFLNTLPIRTQFEPQESFGKTVRRTRQTVLQALSNSRLPFEQIAELTARSGRLASRSLHRIMFVLLEEDFAPLCLDTIEGTPIAVDTQTCKNDLTLSIRGNGRKLSCRLQYSSELFSAERISGMVQQIVTLCQSVVENPARPISKLDLISSAERQKMLIDWNQTAQDYPLDRCIHQLFEEQAKRTPDAAALRYRTAELSYGEVDRQANGLAKELCKLGVAAEVRVGLCVPRSQRMLIAQIAILKAGGAYVPLDPHAPAARLNLILQDAEISLLITERALLPLFPEFEGTGLFVDEWNFSEVEQAPASDVNAANAAYVMYTSGSTGRPKGVVIEHRSATNLLYSMRQEPGVGPSDVLLAVTTMSFDISVLELFLPLIVGACVVIVPDDLRADGTALGALIEESGATVFQATPATWQMLMRTGWQSRRTLKALCGGEALSSDLARQILERCPELWNLYGPTETTIWSLRTRVYPEDAITIGGPISNTALYVVDRHGEPTPIGIPGELWIGGAGVARGYLKRPELTYERFIPNPFSSGEGERVYRTGDLARWLPNGTIEFLGRLDTQIKVRGYRVELGEIEATLLDVPGVREAVALLRVSPGGEPLLVAYLVANPEERPTEEALRHRLFEKLPDYMVPNSFLWIDQLPLSPNGKVDRKALAEREIVGDQVEVEDLPGSLMEVELIRIWQRLFKKKDIGRQDNFFSLGGHSLLATQLTVEIQKLLNFKLPIATLFQSPTVELLARRLVDQSWTPPWSSLVALQPEGSKPPIIFVHGWGGYVYPFLNLTRLLGPDQPCYGVQAVEVDNRAARHFRIEAMAEHYVRELVSFQKDGPFYLAGHSMGGLIAYEVAAQLRRLGREVAFVALLDSKPQRASPFFIYLLAMITEVPSRAALHVRRLSKMDASQRASYLRENWERVRFSLSGKERYMRSSFSSNSQPSDPSVQLPDSMDHYFAVAHAYRTRRYSGAIDVFLSDETSYGWRWYWKLLARDGAKIHRVPGGHRTMMDLTDNLPSLATSINLALRSRQEQRESRKDLPLPELRGNG